MKKCIVLLLILTLTLTFCLTACNDDQDPSQLPSDQEPAEQKPIEQEPTGNTVSEQQWQDAVDYIFSVGNMTHFECFEFDFERTTYLFEIEDVSRLWGGYEQVEENGVVNKIESYYSNELDKYYTYARENDLEWSRWEESRTSFNKTVEDLKMRFEEVSLMLKDKYSEFTYNSEKKQYESTSIVTAWQFDDVTSYVVKFKDGKLESIEVEGKVEGARLGITFTYSNYGTTTITLPTEYVEQVF